MQRCQISVVRRKSLPSFDNVISALKQSRENYGDTESKKREICLFERVFYCVCCKSSTVGELFKSYCINLYDSAVSSQSENLLGVIVLSGYCLSWDLPASRQLPVQQMTLVYFTVGGLMWQSVDQLSAYAMRADSLLVV